jgi:hypothetical protein
MDRHHILEEYKGIREVRTRLQTELASKALKGVLEVARGFGMARGNTIVLDAEGDMAFLSDQCLYGQLEGGKTWVERHYKGGLPAEGTIERRTVEGMLRARFAVLAIEDIDTGLGVVARDLVRGERLLLVDIGLSLSAEVGGVLAGRVLDYGAYHTTTGALLPFDPPTLGAARREVLRHFGRELEALGVLDKESDVRLGSLIMRTGLARGANQKMIAVGPGDELSLPHLSPPAPMLRASPKVGRNERCPCGSGKKYKKCCGG